MDNDAIHKLGYRQREFFADLLRLVVPELAAELDLDAAEEVSAAHVGPRPAGFEQRHGDVTWRVPFKAGRLKDGNRPYVLVLLEFQSTVDRTMARRMRNYGAMLRERLVADGTARREGGLPWLLPLVLHNGSERWTAAGAGGGRVALPSAAAWRALAPYQADDYVLSSLERLLAADPDLARLPPANRAAATMRLQLGRSPSDLERRLRTERARFPGAGNENTRWVLHVWAEALIEDMADDDEPVSALPSFSELEGLTEETDMTTISQARLGKWYRDYRAVNVARGVKQGLRQGIEQGIKQGVEQGIKQGVEQGIKQGVEQGIKQGVEQGVEQGIERERRRNVDMMRRLAAVKFDAHTADRFAAILGDHPTAERMEQAGVAIMECNDGDELLARCSEMAP